MCTFILFAAMVYFRTASLTKSISCGKPVAYNPDVERQDATSALSRPRDVPGRYLNPSLRNAVDHGKLIGRQLSLHDIVDDGECLALSTLRCWSPDWRWRCSSGQSSWSASHLLRLWGLLSYPLSSVLHRASAPCWTGHGQKISGDGGMQAAKLMAALIAVGFASAPVVQAQTRSPRSYSKVEISDPARPHRQNTNARADRSPARAGLFEDGCRSETESA